MAGLLAKNKYSQAEGNYYKNSWGITGTAAPAIC